MGETEGEGVVSTGMRTALRPTAAYNCSDLLPGGFLRGSPQLSHTHQRDPADTCVTRTAHQATCLHLPSGLDSSLLSLPPQMPLSSMCQPRGLPTWDVPATPGPLALAFPVFCAVWR